MRRHYVGYVKDKGFKMFTASYEPTLSSHGDKYIFVMGPFQTKRGAEWAEKYGTGNPHFRHVSDAEKFAAKEKFKKSGRRNPFCSMSRHKRSARRTRKNSRRRYYSRRKK